MPLAFTSDLTALLASLPPRTHTLRPDQRGFSHLVSVQPTHHRRKGSHAAQPAPAARPSNGRTETTSLSSGSIVLTATCKARAGWVELSSACHLITSTAFWAEGGRNSWWRGGDMCLHLPRAGVGEGLRVTLGAPPGCSASSHGRPLQLLVVLTFVPVVNSASIA